jgi:hypothetical protein
MAGEEDAVAGDTESGDPKGSACPDTGDSPPETTPWSAMLPELELRLAVGVTQRGEDGALLRALGDETGEREVSRSPAMM